jgi:DNA topoisomerase II
MGGKDAASPRYIFTKVSHHHAALSRSREKPNWHITHTRSLSIAQQLEPITPCIFHPDDMDLLNYLDDDGISIEPEYYVPVIPLVLVNGSDGIGTGWSSTVPNHCARQVIANLRMMINGQEPPTLHPNYYGFTGEITKHSQKSDSYEVNGSVERVDDTTLMITELPIRKWTQDYKVFLEGMLTGDKKEDPCITDFRENHTDSTVSFTITAEKEMIDEFEKSKGGLMAKFKLNSTVSTSNMNLFDTGGKIRKFKSAEDIMSSFYAIRLEFYVKRKARLVEKLSKEKRMLENKARFVEEVCRGDLIVSNRKRKEILSELKNRGYELFPKDEKKGDGEAEEVEEETVDTDIHIATLAKGYEYLLGMKIWSLTFEKAEKLRSELAEKKKELADLEATEPSQIWLKDLDAIDTALDDRDEMMKRAQDKENKARDDAQKKPGRGKNAAPKKRAPRKKSLPRKSPPKKAILNNDDADSDVEVIMRKPAPKEPSKVAVAAKQPAKSREAVKPAAKKRQTPPSSPLNGEDLAARLNNCSVTPAKHSGEKRKESPTNESMDSDFEHVAKQNKKAAVMDTNDYDFEDSDESPIKKSKAVKAKKPTGRQPAKSKASAKPAPKRAAPKKLAAWSSDDDDSDDEEIDAPPVRAPPRAIRPRAQVVYKVDESSEEDGDDDGDDDDFE